jgi:hypothetical protein
MPKSARESSLPISLLPVKTPYKMYAHTHIHLKPTFYFAAGEAGILNLLKPWLKSTIAKGISSILTIPEHIAIPLEPGMPDMQKPEGLLIVSAEAFACLDVHGIDSST